MKSKSICLVIHSLPLGGMESVMSEIANFLVNDKNIIVNLVLTSKNTIFYNLSKEIIRKWPEVEFLSSDELIDIIN